MSVAVKLDVKNNCECVLLIIIQEIKTHDNKKNAVYFAIDLQSFRTLYASQ